MTNELRRTPRNPYDHLPEVPASSLTSSDVRDGGELALDVEPRSVPTDATPAHLSFVMPGHALARATLVAAAETRGGDS